MGNIQCCDDLQQKQKYQFKQEISFVEKKLPIRLPELSEPIKIFIERQKPFQNQIPKNADRFEYGRDIYQGQTDQRNRPHGYGRMYYKNGSLFIGKYIEGIANGNGIYLMKDGSYYSGQIVDNKATDQNGYYWSSAFQYRGGFQDSKFNGSCKQKGSNYWFQGVYQDHKKVQGKFNWKNSSEQSEYEGKFNNQGNFQGIGVLKNMHGTYKGDFVNGLKHGYGQFTYNNGIRYKGEYFRNKKDGAGKIYNNNGTLAYDGYFKNDMPDGQGKSYVNGVQSQTVWKGGLDSKII